VLLVFAPFVVWLFPGRVGAGRPTPVPRHEPVRGFAAVSKTKATAAQVTPPPADIPVAQVAPPQDGPPPGTPKEFLGMPVVPPKKKPAPVDPEKLAKLKQKMREQGMLGDE
jgi:hypothetical protein